MQTSKLSISFKKNPASPGLAGVGEAQSTKIKADKIYIGDIVGPSWRERGQGWRVSLAIVDDSKAGWRWFTVKETFATEELARDWVRGNLGKFSKTYPLYFELGEK